MTIFADMETISHHIEKYIGKIHIVFHEIVSDDLHIDICHVKSSLLRRYEVLVTMGMSAKAMSIPDECYEPKYIELMILLPKGWPLTKESFTDERNYWPIRLLKDLARFVHHGNSWFGFGHTIANTENENQFAPYAENTNFCACALMPSITLGESAYLLKREPETENIGFLSVIPLYEQELKFKFENGIDALLDLFDKFNVKDKLDLDRKAVVT